MVYEVVVTTVIDDLAHWLSGKGSVLINDVPEDVAEVEICPAQIRQWLRYGAQVLKARTASRLATPGPGSALTISFN